MTDAVKVALIALAGGFLTNLTAIIACYLSLNRKVNGMNKHLQAKLDQQSVDLKDGAERERSNK